MTDPESFLSRWSRKKRDAVDEPTPAPPAEEVAAGASSPVEQADKPLDKPMPTSPSEPAFDPASLPSLDAIGAQTDIRDFLRPGVPPDLTRAALRRAWTADPAILNFKGLQENDWDFNDPNSMFGFGELDPDFDVKRMLASVFGETPKEPISPSAVDNVTYESSESSPVTDEVTTNGDHREPEGVVLPVNDGTGAALESVESVSSNPNDRVVQCIANVALQKDESNSTDTPGAHTRSHGGALPR